MSMLASVHAGKRFLISRASKSRKHGLAVMAMMLVFHLSLAGQSLASVAGCWNDITGMYTGDLAGTASAGAQSDATSASGNNLVVDGAWMIDVGADGSLLVGLGGGVTGAQPLIMGTGQVNMDTGLVDMFFSVPLIEDLLGDAAPFMGFFPGTGLFDCSGNFSFIIPDIGFTMNGSLNAAGAASGTWAFDFTTVVDTSLLNPNADPVLSASIFFSAGGSFSGDRETASAPASPVIRVSSKGTGTVSPTGDVAVADGGSQAFVFTPAGNCEVLDVLVDGASVGAVTGYTFDNVTADHTLEVLFGSATLWNGIPGVYTGDLQGTMTVPGRFMLNDVEIPFAPALTGTWMFNVGADGSLTVTLGGGLPITIPGQAPIPMDIVGTGNVDTMTGAAQMSFTVPVFGTYNGTGQLTCDRQFSFAIPDIGFVMSGTLNPDGSASGTWDFDSSFCFVSFSAGGLFDGGMKAPAGSLMISATVKGAGQISPAGLIAPGSVSPAYTFVASGDSQAYTFTPGSGCEVLGVLVDGVPIGAVTGYTFDNVTANHTLEVFFGSPSLWATVPGTYSGAFDGEARDPVLFPVEGTWRFTVDEAGGLSITVNGPSILGTFGTITGQGTVDPLTGWADIVYTIPIHGNAAGTGQFDCQGGFSFDVPGLGFSMNGQTQVDGGVTGSWAFDSSLFFVKIGASGSLIDSRKYSQPRTLTVTAIGAGKVDPFGVKNETRDIFVESGDATTLLFTAEGGCQVLDVIVDGASVGPVSDYAFDNITADHTVAVTFGSDAMWDNIPGIYTGTMSGNVSYAVMGSAAQNQVIDGTWTFDVGEDGQLDILIQGLPVVGDVRGTGRIADLRTGYAPMTFSLPALDSVLFGLNLLIPDNIAALIPPDVADMAGQVPRSLPGYGQFYCDNSLHFKMSFFGMTMIMDGVVGDDGSASGTWDVSSAGLFVAIDGQGEYHTNLVPPPPPDVSLLDPDNDGLTNGEEAVLGTNPFTADTDGDGMKDGWEADNGLNPLVADADGDPDGDGLINWYEYQRGTDPNALTAGPGIPLPVAPRDDDGGEDEPLSPPLIVTYRDGFGGELHAASVWQVSLDAAFSQVIFEATSETALLEMLLPGALLAPDTVYNWRAQFIDTDNWEWKWCDPVSFTTGPAVFEDVNGNNVADDREVTDETDLNGNGVPDGEEDLFRVLPGQGAGEVGLEFGLGFQALEYLDVIDPGDLPREDRPLGRDFPYGLISFRLTVENPGDTATVTFYFPEPLPEGTVWYKYDTVNGWRDFSAWARFSEDRRSVVLTLVDGGAGDADGVVNGVIVDPSGPATVSAAVTDPPADGTDNPTSDTGTPTPNDGGGGGGGGSCFISVASGW
ncbi:MAG: choice-of-anchor U domain-containing protein [Thermodesulfobacteriota bacterium]